MMESIILFLVWSWLNTEELSSFTILVARSLKLSCQEGWCLLRPLALDYRWFFFCVFMGCFLCSVSQPHLLETPFKDTSHGELESTKVALFFLHSLFKDLLFKCSHILQRVKVLAFSVWEDTAQPIIPPRDYSCSHRAHSTIRPQLKATTDLFPPP